ncbi:MAG: hypothetical protein KJO60_07235 [Desulfofustis sp.]|nr:hypothetical protein [Desulfofustis sp.]NNK57675.1 hypothetical protein [Desulfofustis sp.]
MGSPIQYPTPYVLLATLGALLLGSTSVDCVAGQVAATLNRDNQNLILEVSVPSPPPSSIIAGIKLPKNTKIVGTSPKSAKIDLKRSSVKWLVKNPRPGTQRFSASTSPPADFTKVSAEILYRAPGGGSLIKVDAQKR